MNIRRVASLVMTLMGLAGCITIFGCSAVRDAGHTVTNALEITNDQTPVDLDAEVESSSDELNAFTYENYEARNWVTKTWSLLFKIYATPEGAKSVDARIRVLRDADATGRGEEKDNLNITEAEARAGYKKTFRSYAVGLGKHPTPVPKAPPAASESAPSTSTK